MNHSDYSEPLKENDMSNDPTEGIRRVLQAVINEDAARTAEMDGPAAYRRDLERDHGDVYDTDELSAAFTVVGFSAPFVRVIRKSDGAKGIMAFSHHPRLYWGFTGTGA